MKVRKAVIPAAGLGTRMLPATKAQPKEMLTIVDTPVIQHVVLEAIQSGIEDILIVTGRSKQSIEDYFDHAVELEAQLAGRHKDQLLQMVESISNMVNIHFIRQKEPLGLGHAVAQARQHVGGEPFAVLLPDELFAGPEPCLSQLIKLAEQKGSSTIAVRSVPLAQVSRYGVIDSTDLGGGMHLITSLVEKPEPALAPSTLAVVGRYVLTPDVFDILVDLRPGRGGEIQLTDALDMMARLQPLYGYEVTARRYDVGEIFGYLQANVEFALDRADLAGQFRQYLRELLNSR